MALANSSMFWNVRAMPRPAIRYGGTSVMSWSWKISSPGGRLIDAADQVEDRRLAGAVRADDREHLALLHLEADRIHGADAAEADRDVVGAEQAHRSRSDRA